MSYSKPFLKAKEISGQVPLPDDIIEQLDDLYDLVTEDEKDKFLWFYEQAELSVNLLTEEEANA